MADTIIRKTFIGLVYEDINTDPIKVDVQININASSNTITGIFNQNDIKSLIEGEIIDEGKHFNFRITSPDRVSYVEANY